MTSVTGRCFRWLLRAGLATTAAALVSGSAAQTPAWPTKTIRVIAAGPAGGTADITARLLADGLAKELGKAVIVDPKSGAAGAIAVQELLAAPRDGHTVLVGVNSLVSEIPHIVKLKLDMARAIRPIAELARGGLVLVASPGWPPRTVTELVAYAKAHPGQVNYASYSPGTMSHILGLQLARAAGIELTHVGYKGSTQALADVMGGHVPMMFDGMPTSIPLIKAGKVKALAVSTPKRSPLLPGVPTFTELGYPDLQAIAWMGLWATPDAPSAAQARLRDAALRVMAQPAMHQRLRDAGFEPGEPRTTDDMGQTLRADSDRVGALLRSIGFQPQ